MNKSLLIFTVMAALSLSGCTGLLVGGAVAGAAAVATTIHDRRTPGRVIDDRALEASIGQRIAKDTYVDSYSHSNLTVFNGVVLLTGEAVNQSIAERIIQIANTTPNVKRVESDIFIGPKSNLISRANDSAITTKVKAALLSLNIPKFDPSLINVSTERGNVYLMGFVTRAEAGTIMQKTRQVNGVRSVIDVFEYVASVQ